MDMHSIIVSCIHDEPLFTAEQVMVHLSSAKRVTFLPCVYNQINLNPSSPVCEESKEDSGQARNGVNGESEGCSEELKSEQLFSISVTEFIF